MLAVCLGLEEKMGLDVRRRPERLKMPGSTIEWCLVLGTRLSMSVCTVVTAGKVGRGRFTSLGQI